MKSWWGYNLEHGCNPFKSQIDPYMAIYWMYDRVRRLGSCNSYKSWSSALSWWVEAHDGSPKYYYHPFYKRVHSTMLTLYLIPRKVRLPARIDWISQYLDSLGVRPDTWSYVDLEILEKAWCILMTFFSISRPSEVLHTDSTENVEWEIIATGLRWGDVTLHNMEKPYCKQYMRIKIEWYKNKVHRNQPKYIYMAPPICNEPNCKCQKMDFFAMFKILRKRRNDHFQTLQRNMKYPLTQTSRKMLANLKTAPMNYIFVGKKGEIWRPQKLTEIMDELKEVVKMKNPSHYIPYSLRIGATSLCNQQQIDLLKLLKYVGWSINDLPHVSNRYIMFGIRELKLIPFEMIHGRNNPGGRNIDRSHKKLTLFNPWEGEACNKIFDLH